MKRLLGAALLYPLCFMFGCSPSGSSGPNDNGNGGGNSGTGSTGANGGQCNYGCSVLGGSTSNPMTDVDAACVGEEEPAKLTRVNILFLLDKSGSMGDDPNGGWNNAADRWNPVATTLRAFFEQPSTGLYASLSFLPADGDITTACKVTSYEDTSTNSIKVKLTLLDDAGRQKFLAKLCDPAITPPAAGCIVPAGGTPTRPALQGTIDYAAIVQQNSLKDNTDSKTVIVFLTDGEPSFGYVPSGSSTVNQLFSCDDLTNGCPLGPAGASGAGTCSSADAEVAKVADVIASAPPKSIYLFGVGDLSTSTMETWADASGNGAVALQGMSGTQAAATLASALKALRTTQISCNIKIPTPAGGAAIDKDKVNVRYTDGSGKVTQLTKSVGCTSTQPSWQYDNPNAPTYIELCPSTCASLQQDPAGKVTVIFGCATIIN
jgi:hypothetical protein